ncbi:SprB repeat-containing protein [Flavihumibacter rivuli]|uniref:T9SS type A sorting domain-containing protein n=1 Tax=Flavihumibacter rivuli TaxID=2838156 RepID=UPI001EFA9B73|nr:T9SS type A sorting domain-containing protein [Flavihumibacter rivuli]ULQ58040.1 SprB repeat-containing protein [Flavihumibacter rivuli]
MEQWFEDADLSNLTAGNYTLEVTDAKGCKIGLNVTITEPEAALDVQFKQTDVNCYGESTGAIDVTVTGGTAPYTYNWSNGADVDDLSNLAAGDYTLEVTDAKGCKATIKVTITQPEEALNATAVITDASCEGSAGKIDVTVTGGTAPYTFEWSNGGDKEDLENIGAGNYSVTITDAKGCTFQLRAEVKEPSGLKIEYGQTDVNCYGESTGAIDVTVTGGTAPYTYKWSNGSEDADLSNLAAGNYTLEVTDAKGCKIGLNVTIIQPEAALDIQFKQTDVNCYGESTGAIDVTVTGGTAPYTYNWSNGADVDDLSNLAAGDYTLEVTDAKGCKATIKVTITQPDQALSAQAVPTNGDCSGSTGSINLTVTGGTAPYTYEWSNGALTEDIDNLAAGNYSVIVTDAKGCTTSARATVEQSGSLEAKTIVCDVRCVGESNGSVNLTVTGGVPPYTYTWSNGATTEDLFNVPAGNYSVVIKDSKGCVGTASAVVGSPAPINCYLYPTSVIQVNAGATTTVTVSASGGTGPYTYTWSIVSGPGSIVGGQGTNKVTIKAGSTAGKIVVKVSIKDSKGCCKECTKEITVLSCVCPEQLITYCTYPQQFYGSTSGAVCTPTYGQLSPVNLITQSIKNMPNGNLYFGLPGRSFWTPASNAARLNSILPGSGTPAVLSGNLTAWSVPLTNGKINNVLLSQTITLALNMYITPDRKLGNFRLEAGKWLVTQKRDWRSTCSDPKPMDCFVNGVPTTSYNSWFMPANVVNALGSNKTVWGLFTLASNSLGGAQLPVGVTLSDIVRALDVINNAFNDCRFFVKWSDCKVDCSNIDMLNSPTATSVVTTPTVSYGVQSTTAVELEQPITFAATVTAFPNPFVDRVQFQIKAVETGKVSLEVFNELGQRVSTLFNAQMRQGEVQNVEYKPNQSMTGGLIYRLTSNGKVFTGKLLQASRPIR